MGDGGGKIVALLLSLGMLWQAWAVRRVVGTWLAPGCLYALFWFLMTFIPLVILLPVPIEPLSIAYILLTTTAFSAGSLLCNWKFAIAANQEGSRENAGAMFGSWFVKWGFWVFTMLSLACMVANSLIQDFTLYDIVFNLMESSERYTAMRYKGEITVNLYGQLSVVFSYIGVSLGGFVFDAERSRLRRGLVLLFSFLPSVAVMITQSAKGMFFLAIVMFYAAILVARLKRGELQLFSRGFMRRAILGALVTLPILTVSFLSRGLYESKDTDFIVDRLVHYFASYSCGHLYAFSDWFSSSLGSETLIHYDLEEPSYGFYTFMSLFNLAGVGRPVPPGVFDEYFQYKDLLTSNIYTMFRGLILDYGLAGSLVFTFVSSVLFHLAFYALLVNRRAPVATATYIFMVGYIYTSFIISLLIWNSIYVAYAILVALLWLNSNMRFPRRQPRPENAIRAP